MAVHELREQGRGRVNERAPVAATTVSESGSGIGQSALADAFAFAASSAGMEERRFTIAGDAVAFRFAGNALRNAVGKAFSHLERSPDAEKPTLQIDLWESDAEEGRPPLPATESGQAPGAMYHYRDEGVEAIYQPGLGVMCALDLGARRAWYWTPDSRRLPYWERATPLRQILHWWLASSGRQQVHGGAVGTMEHGGVLVVGNPGSGKSTTTLACLGSELLFAGDDYVAVELEPTPWVHSLYNSGKVAPDHVRRLPQIRAALGDTVPDQDKAVAYVHEHYPEATVAGFPLRAILLPRVTDRERPAIFEAAAAAALKALAPSTIVQLHTAGRDALMTMSLLVREVPSYVFELGRDIEAIPDTIAEFLRDLPRGDR
jgi:hypothetical protein